MSPTTTVISEFFKSALSTKKAVATAAIAAGSVAGLIWYIHWRPTPIASKPTSAGVHTLSHKPSPQLATTPTTTESTTMTATPTGDMPEFDVDQFQGYLETAALGRKFFYAKEATTTMTLAQDAISEAGASECHGKIFMVETQSNGVGRRSRSWVSMPQGNIYMSFVWDVGHLDTLYVKMKKLSQLNIACGISVAKAAKEEGVEAGVKWPNDVWSGDHKFSGMIVDFKDKKQAGAVVGIGINVNQDCFDAETAKVATSLRKELSRTVSREKVLAKLCNEIERLMIMTPAETLEEYTNLDILSGKVVRVFHKSREVNDGRDYNATVLGYDEDGSMKVAPIDHPDEIKMLSGQEISVRPVVQE